MALYEISLTRLITAIVMYEVDKPALLLARLHHLPPSLYADQALQ